MDMLRGIINCDVCLFQHVMTLTVTCAPVLQYAHLARMDTRWNMKCVTVSITILHGIGSCKFLKPISRVSYRSN